MARGGTEGPLRRGLLWDKRNIWLGFAGKGTGAPALPGLGSGDVQPQEDEEGDEDEEGESFLV